MRLFCAIFLPFICFFIIDKPGTGLICLFLQLTVIGWIPAALWAVYTLSEYNTHQIIDARMKLFEQQRSV
jgi:uncharacterized membrane protein YqaE (UPF0057 family)